MILDAAQYLLGAGSGGLVGLSLGLFGGGGSILAVPAMVYLVGVPNAHVAIGTSAVAVVANAAAGLLEHARHGTVCWRCAAAFSLAGVLSALAGSVISKTLNGQNLLILFAFLMIVVGAFMFRSRNREGDPDVDLSRENAPKLVGAGALTGGLSGFFGIGGGFLIVPSLMAATGMPIVKAIGSSLVAVTAFGLATASSYALSGLVEWRLAAVFIGGGFVGSKIGCFAARSTAVNERLLRSLFAGLIVVVSAYMIAKGWQRL